MDNETFPFPQISGVHPLPTPFRNTDGDRFGQHEHQNRQNERHNSDDNPIATMNSYVSVQNGDFVLKRVDTPRGWDNLLSNENYVLQLSQLGSGFSVYRTLFGNRVTRQAWPEDSAGRFFYLRDAATSAFWSPTAWPVETDTTAFRQWSCTYAPDSMEWNFRRDRLNGQLRVAVAADDNVELYRLTLANASAQRRQFDLFFFLEWWFAGAPEELGSSVRSDYDRTAGALVGELEIPPQYRYCQTGFIAASEPIRDWDGNRRDFLGQPGTIAAPAAVRRGRCGQHPGGRLLENPAGAVRCRLNIAAHAKTTFVLLVGICESRSAISRLKRKYLSPAKVDAELARVKSRWQRTLAPQAVDSPALRAGHGATWANRWLKMQVVQNFRYTRWAGHRGYRDVLQDSAGMRLVDPALARQRILEALRHQRADGFAPRQYPLAPWGAYDWRDYRDSPFWIVYALEKYLKETGEFGILNERVRFFDSARPETVFEHARRAVDFLWRERGAHGLCLLGCGDWLDSLNAAGTGGKGESIWLTQALCYALREMERLTDQPRLRQTFRARRATLADTINRAGWDGRWYLMAYNDAGHKIGSAKNRDGGQMFLNPQSWAVLAGVADAKRTRAAMQACDDRLGFDAGYLCFAPMYRQFDPGVGRISLWPSEGASVYSHAVFFKIAADCALGEGDRAWETLCRVVPAAGRLALETTGAEPFTIPNAYMGPAWPRPLWTYQGWWTASAAWALQILVEEIFGARADYDGLRIDPCLPRAWTEARVCRQFRGHEYDIRITKKAGLCRGRVTVCLDGQELPDNLIPAPLGAGFHEITVRIS